MRKFLYLLHSSKISGAASDAYDSAVVCARDREEARRIHPSGRANAWIGMGSGDWDESPDTVSVKLLGEARETIPLGVVCASFNAA